MDPELLRLLLGPAPGGATRDLIDRILGIPHADDIAALLLAAVLAAVAVAKSCRPIIRGFVGEWKARRLLRRLGVEAAHDLLLPREGEDGWTQVDHLAKLPDRILVLETKNLSGRLSGREGDPTWTQRFGTRSIPLMNPLRQNALHLAAVRALAGPAVRVEGMVLLVGDGWFDERVPDGCYRFGSFRKRLLELNRLEYPRKGRRAQLDAAWQRVLGSASRRLRDRRRHRLAIERAHGRERRLPAGLAYAIGSGVTIGLYLAA
jgi:Nuclease-related domain